MKRIVILILLFFSAAVFGQQNNAFTYKSIEGYPHYLFKNWKFISGDKIVFASPAYDDSMAIEINPILNLLDVKTKNFKGIGWFRFHFTIDSTLAGSILAFAITHYGASQIYVDGKLLKSFGQIAGDTGSLCYDPQEIPFVFTLADTGQHLLAVRYANYNAQHNADFYDHQHAGFKFMVGLADKLIHQKNLRSTIFSFTLMLLCGIFITLSLLHLLMYLYHKSEKSNLSFSIFMISLAAIFVICFICYANHNPGVELKSVLMLIPVVTIACLSLSGFINELFAKRIGIRFWLIVILGMVSMLLGFAGSDFYTFFLVTLIIIVSFEAAITIIFAMNRKIKGAQIIGAGILFLTLFIITIFFISIAKGGDIDLNDDNIEGQILILFLGLAILSTPFSMSVYQAWRFARVNKDLALQLENVNRLSLESLQHEQEKQRMLENRKEELENEIEMRTNELKESQQQLVQQEKLASLGALTAGIAHEIKNPLNFVNNFSELSTELVDEFINAKDEEERNEIAFDLKLNLQKINEHGKRADSIVKNMLEHSRNGSGEKQLVDINKMCEEYLNLAYHGKRASNQQFNCKMISQFDKNLPQVNCVAQDISRVILNLMNNAFDELNLKSDGVLELSTQKANDKVLIKIKDNGRGIPDNIKEKIFEPFFTTKPAGQGTGLGLSLSYDIIKAHGGELKVESTVGEGSTFIIQLPLV